MIKRAVQNILFIISITMLPMLSAATEPDWSDYNQLLQTYVQPGSKHDIALNLVEYQALKADVRWPRLLTSLAEFDLQKIASPTEQLSFWINTYNILAIKTVLDHWPLQSIRDAGSFFSPVWKKTAGMVAGEMRSLHDIEHEILRPMGEPRIHFAIVCASVSCPDLKASAYDALHLEKQLDAQAKAFVTHPDKGLSIQGNKLHSSKIFDWFEDDFQAQGGVINFIRNYRNDLPEKPKLASHLDYDWSLNAINP